MIYLLLFLAVTALLLYVTSRWLRGELRELLAWIREKWTVFRGGENQNSLIAATRHAFHAEGLQPDFLVVARHVVPAYEQLRQQRPDPAPGDPPRVAVVLALAADTGAQRLYLRAMCPRPGGPPEDTATFVDFTDIHGVDLVPRLLPGHLAPPADHATVLDLGVDRPAYHLHVEPDWNLSAAELTRRIDALISGEWRPDAPPTVVR